MSSYKDILEKMIKVGMSGPLSDIESGSVLNAFLAAEDEYKRSKLVSFLAKLDSRFKKYLKP